MWCLLLCCAVIHYDCSHHIGVGSPPEDVMHDQYMFWKNAHNLGNSGSLYFHELVASSADGFENGVVYYSLAFVQELVRVCNYLPVDQDKWQHTKNSSLFRFVPPYRNEKISMYVSTTSFFVQYRKLDMTEFITFEDFKQLPGISLSRKKMVTLPYHDSTQMRLVHISMDDTNNAELLTTVVEMCDMYPLPDVSSEDCEQYSLWYLIMKIDPSFVDLMDPLYIYDHVSADIINKMILLV